MPNTGTAGNPVRLDHHGDGSYSIRADQATQDELMKDQGLQRHIMKGNMVWDLPKMSPGDGAQAMRSMQMQMQMRFQFLKTRGLGGL